MKKNTKYLFKIIALFSLRIWSFIFSYHRMEWLCAIRNSIYTLWIRNHLGEVGDNSVFHYPLRIEGDCYRKIRIGSRTIIQSYCILGCRSLYGDNDSFNPVIMIGSDCNIGEFTHISAIDGINIGNGLLTGRFVYIGDNAHGGLSWENASIPPAQRALKSKGGIIIGNNVWLCDKVTILGGVKIGDNVIIGANSVVTHNIPSNSIAVGVPAKVVSQLCDDNISS